MRIRGTDFVMFLVSDLKRAADFYRDILNLHCDVSSDEYQWAEFDGGNVTLSLKGKALPAGARAGGRIAFAVEDIGAAYEELLKQGVPVAGAPTDHGCCCHMELQDPDGNVIILHRRADGSFG